MCARSGGAPTGKYVFNWKQYTPLTMLQACCKNEDYNPAAETSTYDHNKIFRVSGSMKKKIPLKRMLGCEDLSKAVYDSRVSYLLPSISTSSKAN